MRLELTIVTQESFNAKDALGGGTMRNKYKCLACGVIASFYAFRGASGDGSYLKCFNCGSTKVSEVEEELKEE